jgi:hypothetical protein
MPKFNDLDIENWKESDIWTDSLWIINERDKSGKHSNFYQVSVWYFRIQKI